MYFLKTGADEIGEHGSASTMEQPSFFNSWVSVRTYKDMHSHPNAWQCCSIILHNIMALKKHQVMTHYIWKI